jgi:hypothetical protein
MTQDEIIEMADKADAEADKVLNMKGEFHPNWHQVRDEAFAKLVAEKEREACANIVEENANKCGVDTVAWMILASNAEAIRARGNYRKGETD